ncbi:MAG: DUF58 domain-containing protein [Deinococcaceae bacterium]
MWSRVLSRLVAWIPWILGVAFVAFVAYRLWGPLQGYTALLWLALLGVFVLLTWPYYRTPPKFKISRNHIRYTTVGDRVQVELSCELVAFLPVRLSVFSEPPAHFSSESSLELAGLFWGPSRQVVLSHVRPTQRGEWGWPAVSVYWSDPFGLFWHRLDVEVASDIMVFPKRHVMMMPDLLRPLLSDGKQGARIGLEDPASLRGVREYQLGDALNRIHWRQTAKHGFMGRPMVRELERVSSSTLQIHIDLRASSRFIESAVKLASSLIHLAQSEYQIFSISTAKTRSQPGRDEAALIDALSLLAKIQPDPSEGPEVPLPAFGANVIVITEHPRLDLIEHTLKTRAKAARVLIVLMHEGFYLEPGDQPQRIWAGLHESAKQLERQAAVLLERGVRVFLLRANQSALELGRLGR